MIKLNKILLLFIIISSVSYSQELILKDYVIEERDTILLSEIPVIEIITFKDVKERVKYNILKRKVLKVYPYAFYTKNKLEEIEKGTFRDKKKKEKEKIHKNKCRLF